MTVEQHTLVNSVATAQPKPTTEFLQLQQQITELTAQVIALTTQQASSATVDNRRKRCCNKVGHLQYNCPTPQDPRFVSLVDWRTCPKGNCLGQQLSLSVSPQLVMVATMRNKAIVNTGKVGDVFVEIMLDTGSAVSLLHHREANSMNIQPSSQVCSSIQLVTASGESLPIISCVEAPVQMADKFMMTHQFLIVDSLIYPVILGTDQDSR